MNIPKPRSPLDKAKDRIDIIEAAKRLNLDLGLCGDGSCRSPFRQDREPSFSIYAGGTRWKDFGTDEGGDVVDFIAKVLDEDSCDLSLCRPNFAIDSDNDDEDFDNGDEYFDELAAISKKDLDWSCGSSNYKSDAAKLLIKWDREGSDDPSIMLLRSKRKKRAQSSILEKYFEPLEFRMPLSIEIQSIVRGRQLKNSIGILELIKRGMLRSFNFYDIPCWVLLDESGHNAQARAIDPKRLLYAKKAHTLKGSTAAWPIGLPYLEHCSQALICEGPPDLLAVATALHLEHPQDVSDVALIAKTGTANIPEELLSRFENKRVRYFADNDRAGLTAAKRIEQSLNTVNCQFDCWVSDVPGEDFNDYASRRWKCNEPIEATKNGLALVAAKTKPNFNKINL